jgi:hypothetical protein
MSSAAVNRYAYGLLTLVGLALWVAAARPAAAALMLAAAAWFDPFLSAGRWRDRESWQQTWYAVHLGLTLLMFAWSLVAGGNS